MDKVINSCLSFANSYPRLCIAPFRQECSFPAALSRREEALTLFMLTRWKEHVSIFAHGSIQPTFINIRGSAKRESERRRFWGTLAARFIDIFAPWMWQVLLGYLWTAEVRTPASGDSFFGMWGKYTAHSVNVAETFMNVLCLVRTRCVASHWQRAQNDGESVFDVAGGWKSPTGRVARPWKHT